MKGQESMKDTETPLIVERSEELKKDCYDDEKEKNESVHSSFCCCSFALVVGPSMS